MPRIDSTDSVTPPRPLIEQLAQTGGKQRLSVHHCLEHYALGREDGCCSESVQTLATTAGMKPNHVRETLCWLQEAGWIERLSRPGQASCYRVRFASQQPSAIQVPEGLNVVPKEFIVPKGFKVVLEVVPEGIKVVLEGVVPEGLKVPEGVVPEGEVPEGVVPKSPISLNYSNNLYYSNNSRTLEYSRLLKRAKRRVRIRVRSTSAKKIDSSPKELPPIANAVDPSKSEPSKTPSTTYKPDPIPTEFDAYAEDLNYWLERRKQKNPRNKLPVWGPRTRSAGAMRKAIAAGVVKVYLEQAAEAGWSSLGFVGYEEVIAKLSGKSTSFGGRPEPQALKPYVMSSPEPAALRPYVMSS